MSDARLIFDPTFFELWRRMNETYLTKREYYTYPLSSSLDREDLWQLLSALRKGASVTMPFMPLLPHSGEDTLWFNLPLDSRSQLHRISSLSSNSTKLWQYLKSKPQCMRLSLILDEIQTACWRDGLAVDRPLIQAIIRDEFHPTSPEAQLIQEVCTIIDSLGKCNGPALTRSSIESLYLSLNKWNVHEDQREVEAHYEVASPSLKPWALDCLAELVKPDAVSYYTSPAICWIAATSILWDYRPFPRYNALMELLIRHAYLAKSNMPALAYIDYLAETTRWKKGEPIRAANTLPYKCVTVDESGIGFDATPFFCSVLEILLEGLNHLSKVVTRIEAVEKELRDRIVADQSLNLRQAALLSEMSGNVEMPITVEMHRNHFGIARSTAELDLTNLHQRGLLHKSYEGRRQVYRLSISGIMKMRPNN